MNTTPTTADLKNAAFALKLAGHMVRGMSATEALKAEIGPVEYDKFVSALHAGLRAKAAKQ
jgi:hypothetical protein